MPTDLWTFVTWNALYFNSWRRGEFWILNSELPPDENLTKTRISMNGPRIIMNIFYLTQISLIARKPQMTLITLIIWSTDFTDYTDFASRYALAASGAFAYSPRMNTNEHELFFLTQISLISRKGKLLRLAASRTWRILNCEFWILNCLRMKTFF